MRSFVFLILAASLFAADPAVVQSQKLIKDQKFAEAIAVLDKAHAANPKSAEVVKALASAHFAAGDFNMYNNELPPFKKYPTALREYRKVLEYDPENQKAKGNIALIENIYKQMGRPIPQ